MLLTPSAILAVALTGAATAQASEIVYLTNCTYPNGAGASEVNWYADAAASQHGEQPNAHSDTSTNGFTHWEAPVTARFADGNFFTSHITDHDGPLHAHKGDGFNSSHGFSCFQDDRELYRFETKVCRSVYYCLPK
jgi:hypothetical protein